MPSLLEIVANRDAVHSTTLPVVVWVVLVATAVAVITAGLTVLGLPVNALAWLVPLVVALIDLAVGPGRVRLPILLWMPWIALILGSLAFAQVEHAFQRSIMILTPLVVGMATSKHVVPSEGLLSFERAYHLLAIGLLAGAVLKTGLAVQGLPDAAPLSAEVMTGSLLAGLFAAELAFGRRRALPWWALLALVPVVALTRMGIIACALTLPLTFAPLGRSRRIVFTVLLLVLGLAVFQTDRVQRKMFVSGRGDVTDMVMDNPNLAMSGRRRVWDYLEAQIQERPWFGHGANASEPVVMWLSHGATHPHNDWLRVRYEYGNFGAVVLGLCMFAQMVSLWLLARRLGSDRRILAYAGASSFVTFSLFMLTDNIILYAPYFGNLQFAIIGLAYSFDAEPRPTPAQP